MSHFILASSATYNIANVIGGRTLITIFISGAFVFGLSGALTGALKSLDFFGVMVLAGIVGLAGGAIRDIFLGIPAVAVFDWRVVLAVVIAGLIAFVAHGPLLKMHYPIQILDAIGLSLFSVIGTDLALVHRSGLVAAVLLGMATGVSGGFIRDVVVNEVPQVLRAELYAIPSLVGSGLVVAGFELKTLSLAWYVMATLVCLAIRLAGIFFKINLPLPR